MSSVCKMIKTINNDLGNSDADPALPTLDQAYFSLTTDSRFLDIGAGIGRVPMHIAA